MTPSVEGRRRAAVAALLIASAAGTGALVGFAAGVAWLAAGLAPLPSWAAAVLAVVAGGLDVAAWRTGGVRPPSVGRQVPREWSRLFSPPTVAVLYGARLGVGPATILSSWLWWAMLVLAAADGVGTSTAAGAVFGGVRTVLMVGVAQWVHRAAASRMGQLRGLEGAARLLLTPLAVGLVGVAALVG